MTKILVIEDDLHTRTGLELILTEEDFSVQTAADPDAALQSLDGTFDIILCDLKLGEASGLDLLKEIRARDSGIAFIVMTAFEMPELHPNVENLKITRWFTKPLNLNSLITILGKIGRENCAAPANGSGFRSRAVAHHAIHLQNQ